MCNQSIGYCLPEDHEEDRAIREDLATFHQKKKKNSTTVIEPQATICSYHSSLA
jgi:hypothetical protein